MTTALLLIDLQNDYFPGGPMELMGAGWAVKRARRMLDAFRAKKWPAIHVRHLGAEEAAFLVPGTPGAEIHELVRPEAGEIVVEKHFPNSFRGTPLLDHVESLGIERLVICGMMTHMCVDSTTRAAYDYGLECMVCGDACATRALEFAGGHIEAGAVHFAFLAALQHVYAEVGTVDDLIATLKL